jgi:hypothetical protein
VRVKGLDSLALEGVEMVGVEEFLCLFGLHCFIEVLRDLENLLVVEREGHAKEGLSDKSCGDNVLLVGEFSFEG